MELLIVAVLVIAVVSVPLLLVAVIGFVVIRMLSHSKQPAMSEPPASATEEPASSMAIDLEDILQRYREDPASFEDAREALLALGPERSNELLEAALDPDWEDVLGVLVMVLADTGYPPALPHMRAWMFVDDEDTAMSAVVGLDAAVGSPLDADRIYGDFGSFPTIRDELARRWDAGELQAPSEEDWLRARQGRLRALAADVPPPQPGLSPEERAAFRPVLIELRQRTEHRDAVELHARDLDAVERHLEVFEDLFPKDERPRRAVEAVAAYLDGHLDGAELDTHRRSLQACFEETHAAARWNEVHKAYADPLVKAAGDLVQAAIYLTSPEPRNRVQAIHFCLNAMEASGAGLDSMRAEVQRHFDALDAVV